MVPGDVLTMEVEIVRLKGRVGRAGRRSAASGSARPGHVRLRRGGGRVIEDGRVAVVTGGGAA